MGKGIGNLVGQVHRLRLEQSYYKKVDSGFGFQSAVEEEAASPPIGSVFSSSNMTEIHRNTGGDTGYIRK